MERILDLSKDFDVELFEKIVMTALSASDEHKKEAEEVLLQFKELSYSWTKVNDVVKGSNREDAKFMALQILEDNVKSKWALFEEDNRRSLRKYVFEMIREMTTVEKVPTIVVNKLNSVLVEIAKKDWPTRWPDFVSCLVNTSLELFSVSMGFASNALVILKLVNEELFRKTRRITTARRQIMQQRLKEEYGLIFDFISFVFECAEKWDVSEELVGNCLEAFRSFCVSMPLELVLSNKIMDGVLGQLNSVQTIATLDCLLEIIKLERGDELMAICSGERGVVRTSEKQWASVEQVRRIEREVLAFMQSYSEAVTREGRTLAEQYTDMDQRVFLGKMAQVLATIYALWFNELHDGEGTKTGLRHLVDLCSIEDTQLFQDVFFVWEHLVAMFYNEYTLHIPTSRVLKRTAFMDILKAMLGICVNNMPKPSEVFIVINELGEIVRDKRVETVEIEFYRRMRKNMFRLAFILDQFAVNYFVNKINKYSVGKLIDNGDYENEYIDTNDYQNVKGLDYNKAVNLRAAYLELNKFCWAIGALSEAFEEKKEREFFVSIINRLLNFCEERVRQEERAIIASNIMFIIGQFQRFLKFNAEFMYVVIRKLFEFMQESYEGIKEMACDNFYRICEKCPTQFYQKKNSRYFLEGLLDNLATVAALDFYLQRIVIEALLIVLKAGSSQALDYVHRIFKVLTPQVFLESNISVTIPSLLEDPRQFMALAHLAESYALGFKILPATFSRFTGIDPFIEIYSVITQISSSKTLILKKSFCTFFEEAVKSDSYSHDVLDNLCGRVLSDFPVVYSPSLLSLAGVMIETDSPCSQQQMRRIQFYISTLVIPAIPRLLVPDNHPEIVHAFCSFFISALNKDFPTFWSLLVDSSSFPSFMNALFATLTSLHDVAEIGIKTLSLIFHLCFENRKYDFFLHFYLSTFENLLGLVFDKDLKSNYALQVDLLHYLILISSHIPSLNHTDQNIIIIKAFIVDLFVKNFQNITENALKIFIEGLFEIKDLVLFKEHINDFTIKIYEYGNDDDIEYELFLLNERVAKSVSS